MSHSDNDQPISDQPIARQVEPDVTNVDRAWTAETVPARPAETVPARPVETVPARPAETVPARPAETVPVRPVEPVESRRAAHTDERTSVLRVPTFSVIAPILGWVLAWGAVVIATSVLQRAKVNTGFGLGIATGGPLDNGFWAGLWLLVVTAGAFLLGGYAAARIARAHGTLHGLLVWVVAMLATAADSVVESVRSGVVGVIRLIPGVSYWAGTELGGRGDAILVLAIFAGAALVGALIGGVLGQTANRVDRTDDAVLIKT